MSSAGYFVTPEQLWSKSARRKRRSFSIAAAARSALAGDHPLLTRSFMVYDALFAWLRHAAEERHNWPAKAAVR